MKKYNIKPFYFPCDIVNISKWYDLDKKRDYGQIIGIDSQMVKEQNSKLLLCKRNDFFINIWSKNQLKNAIKKERDVSNKLDPMVIYPSILTDMQYDLNEAKCNATTCSNRSQQSYRTHKYSNFENKFDSLCQNSKMNSINKIDKNIPQSCSAKYEQGTYKNNYLSNKEIVNGLKEIENEQNKGKRGMFSFIKCCVKRE